MKIASVQFGPASVSRMIMGANPFSGVSHQGPERDGEMLRYYTVARIKETLRLAESRGVTTLTARADPHVVRLLQEYWDDGGTIQWIAQTCPEYGNLPPRVDHKILSLAKATYIHGGTMEWLQANGRLEVVAPVLAKARQAGLAVGVAGHTPAVFRWAEANLDVDFYMCSYYNPTPRGDQALHDSQAEERFCDEDRAAMIETIASLRRPVIHYKVLAAGRNDPAAALGFVRDHWRDGDAVCIGYYTKDHPDALDQNLQLLGLV